MYKYILTAYFDMMLTYNRNSVKDASNYRVHI